jgi:hypothetical protein
MNTLIRREHLTSNIGHDARHLCALGSGRDEPPPSRRERSEARGVGGPRSRPRYVPHNVGHEAQSLAVLARRHRQGSGEEPLSDPPGVDADPPSITSRGRSGVHARHEEEDQGRQGR